jgi:hypothetical protein
LPASLSPTETIAVEAATAAASGTLPTPDVADAADGRATVPAATKPTMADDADEGTTGNGAGAVEAEGAADAAATCAAEN